MKAYWGVEVQLHAFLNSALDGGEKSVVSSSFTPHPDKEPLVPLDRRLGRPQSRSGHSGKEKNSQPLPGLESPITQPVAQRHTAELPGS
jgi:hypothetical protein